MSEIREFSQRVYQSAGVSALLTHLSQRYHLNINILLFCCYYAKVGYGRLSQSDLKMLIQECQNWHEQIINPLIHLKESFLNFKVSPSVNEFITVLQQDILLAEHIEQKFLVEAPLILVKRSRLSEQSLQDAGTSMINYLKLVQVVLTKESWLELLPLFMAVFDDLTEEHISSLLHKIAYKAQQDSTQVLQRHLPLT